MSLPNKKETGELITQDSIPWQTLQEFYHKIVSEKENIRKRFTDSYQYKFSDIEELHHKLTQVAGGYTLETSSNKFTITYVDKNTVCFSHFDQFKMLSQSGANATKSIELEYNFLIKHSTSGELNNYKVTVDVISGIAVFSEIQEEIPKHILSSIGYITGRVKVEFTDFTIGQNFINTVSSWFEARTVAQSITPLAWIQERSDWIPLILRNVFLVLGSYAAYKISLGYLTSESNDQLLASFLIVALSATVIFSEVGFRLGKAIEKAIDQVWKLAFINLNEGDNRLLTKTIGNNKNCWISVAWRFTLTLLFTFIPKLVTDYILH